MRQLGFSFVLLICLSFSAQAQNPSELPTSFRDLLSRLAGWRSPFPDAPTPNFDRLVFHAMPEQEMGRNDPFLSGDTSIHGLVQTHESVSTTLTQGLHANILRMRSGDQPGRWWGGRVLAVTALGGLIRVATASERPPKGDPAWSITEYTDVNGQLFPLKVGNRLSFHSDDGKSRGRGTLVVTERLESFAATPWLAGPFWVIRWEGVGYNWPMVYSEKLGWVVQSGNVNRLKDDPMPQVLRGAVIAGVANGDQSDAINHRHYARGLPAGASLARLPEGWKFEPPAAPGVAATAQAQSAQTQQALTQPTQNQEQSTATVSRRHPSSLRPFYPPDMYSPRPTDSSDDCLTTMRTENCFRRIYERHAVVDADQASRDAKMVVVISRNRRPSPGLAVGIGVHPGFAQSAQVLACNNLEPYDPAESRACLSGQTSWRGQLSPDRSANLEFISCPNGGYFALYAANSPPTTWRPGNEWRHALGVVCGAPSVEAAKRAAQERCSAEAAASGIPPTMQPSHAEGHGCLLAIAGLNDGIDYRHTLPRMNHTNYFCFGRQRQRFNHPNFFWFGHTNVPNSVRIDAACTDQINFVER